MAERTRFHGWRRISADGWAVALIVALTIAVTWHLTYFDAWLEQIDVSNQWLPWFSYLGKRLAQGEIPGWNPYQSGGLPFAGDPQSGWMYFPAMLTFSLLSAISAFKSLMGLELLISGLSMYAFARVMRLGAVAGLAAAFAFEFNLFSNNPTYCCTNLLQTWTWVPMMLLGIELALRAPGWGRRIMPWCLTGFAFSQIYAGWLGQGMVYALLLALGFLAYRSLFADAAERGGLWDRVIVGAATGFASLVISVGMGAAGLLPRYVVSRETLIGQGNYDSMPGSMVTPPSLHKLILNILGSDNAPRGVALGGVAFVLIWFAPFLARRAHGVVFFAAVTFCAYMLMLRTSPLHYALYLIPKVHAIHEHNTINVSAIGAIGPAMLIGATIEALPKWKPRLNRVWLAAAPLAALAVGLLVLGPHRLNDAGLVQIAALAVTVILFVALIKSGRAARWSQIALAAMAFVFPVGVQMASAWTGHPAPSPWQDLSGFSPQRMAAIVDLTADSVPGRAGGFLQDQPGAGGPFRFSGFSSVFEPTLKPPPKGTKAPVSSYTSNRENPFVLAILTNGRAIHLGLYDVSSYNPSQLSRYARFINFINGRTQNYHTTYILPTGFANKLFDLLNVRYVLVDRRLTTSNSKLAEIIKGRHAVYSDPWVTVYEQDAPGSSAWIVHKAKRTTRGRVLSYMKEATFDPRTVAVVEGGKFSIKAPPAGAVETATVTRYEPERVDIDATAASDGLLVVSEVYESGWNAYVDGKPAEIRATDYAFRGVVLTAGHHTVEFRYESASLKWGLWISLLTGALIAALAIWRSVVWFRRRSRDERSSPPALLPMLAVGEGS